jgi:predicted membrane-bound spermidine synthase
MIPRVLPFAFGLSGAAGLIFEIVWFHRAGLAFGNSVSAAAIVLSSFMAGLAVGNGAAPWLASRGREPLRLYAGLEVVVGVTGVALTYVLPHLAGLNLPVVVAFMLLLVPAAAMGATLPVVVAARRDAAFGRALGTLYAANTLGAVAGGVAAEFVLIAWVGIPGAAAVAAALDLVAAGIAIALATTSGPQDRAHGVCRASPVGPRALPLLACAGLAGFAMLALEVIWFRFLSMFVLSTTDAMSVMLAIVLAGIAIGGLAATRLTARRASTTRMAATLAVAASAAVAVSYALFGRWTSGTQVGDWTRVAWLAATLTLPTAVMSGVLFTALGAAIRSATVDDASAAARLTLANTIGAALGPPIAGFVMLPMLGTERSLLALALLYGAIALTLAARDGWRRAASLALAVLLIAKAFPLGAMTTNLARVTAPYAADGSQIVATREGPTESIAVMQQRWMDKPIYSRLVTNGFSMSGTSIAGQRYMRYFVYWPMLLHRTPLERILVICYGAGVTAGAAVDVPTASAIDVVELSRDIVATSDVIYAGARNPLLDSRVRLHIDDGRHFLATTHDRFDLITGEPPPPRTPGAANIYTREYFAMMRDRLAENGIATYWLPVARPQPGTDVNTIVRAFCDVFEDCSLWNATPFDLMLVGTRGGARFDPSRFSGVRDRLAEVGFETPEQIGATFIGDAPYLRELTAATPPLTDDFPMRLRPAADRPSLSDPRYPSNAAVVAQYQRVLDPARARDAFSRSPLIAQWWPPALRDATLPWFDVERSINRVFWEGGKPLRLIDDLDATLTQTILRTLPLWMLDSDSVRQRIAASGNDGTGVVEYVRGAQLLASRDYESAASYFGLAERRGLKSPTVRPLIAYALCRAGRTDMSVKVMESYAAPDEDGRHFAEWMKKHCAAGTAGRAGEAGKSFLPFSPAPPAIPASPAR